MINEHTTHRTIAAARAYAGLNQAQLAKKAGCSTDTIWRLESDANGLSRAGGSLIVCVYSALRSCGITIVGSAITLSPAIPKKDAMWEAYKENSRVFLKKGRTIRRKDLDAVGLDGRMIVKGKHVIVAQNSTRSAW